MIAKRSALVLVAAFASGVSALPASAQLQIFPREQDVPEVRLGQRVQVDDGSCPTGQIKELLGTTSQWPCRISDLPALLVGR